MGQITIDTVPPDFKDDISAELQAMVEENIIAVTDDIETTINNLLDKPAMTGAFSSAAAANGSVPLLGNICHSGYSLSLGGYASLYSYTLDPAALASDLSDLTEEDDPDLGANAQLVHGGVLLPAGYLPRGFQTGLNMAYADLRGSDYFYSNLTLQGSLGYTPFRSIPLNRTFRWTPLSAQFAATFSQSEIGASLETGTITEEFEYEIDSSGLLPPETITVQLDPVVDIMVHTKVYVLTADLSTGFSLLNFIHVYLGGGINVPWGQTDIGVETEDDFEITSNILDEIIEEGSTGSLTISGAVEGSSPVQFLPYCYTGLQFDISSLYISIPFQYTFQNGLSSGIFLGVSL